MRGGSDRAGPADEFAPGARVGVVGDDDALVAAISGAGADVVDGLDSEVAAVVAIGERAVCETARTCPSVPILPVEAGAGFRSVPESTVERAVERLFAGEWDPVEHPVITVDDGVRAVTDTTLVTSDPARISEYTVQMGDDRVATFRADGVVVALPAGSAGYASAAGGPVVALGTDVVAVVPISPFATDPDHWVLPLEHVSLTVEREEATVDLLADDRQVGMVDPGVPVSLSRVGVARTVVVPESQTFP